MVAKVLLSPILDDELLTRGLNDPEARLLVEWLVDQTEQYALNQQTPEIIQREIERLCRRARSISRFVRLWCHEENHGAACQLAAAERFSWPLPAIPVDAFDLMEAILRWEAGA